MKNNNDASGIDQQICRREISDMKKQTRRTTIALTLATVFSAAGSLRGDSLWQKRSPQRAYLCEDSRARSIGDLVTIEITESSEVDNSEDKSMSKTSGNSVKSDFEASSGGGLATQSSNAALDLSNTAGRNFSGKASYRDSRGFTDQITVSVVDVLPNGNLLLAGRRTLTIAGEQRNLVISGMVRAIDLGPDNKVNSRYVADLRTVYEGDGPSRKFVRQGWISRAANKVWPF
jgi:flagellar L-ring protein precursor FlgH